MLYAHHSWALRAYQKNHVPRPNQPKNKLSLRNESKTSWGKNARDEANEKISLPPRQIEGVGLWRLLSRGFLSGTSHGISFAFIVIEWYLSVWSSYIGIVGVSQFSVDFHHNSKNESWTTIHGRITQCNKNNIFVCYKDQFTYVSPVSFAWLN